MKLPDSTKPCPCCSGTAYGSCCQRFHRGGRPEQALQLMRSRYSAYALNLPDYIIKTTHPANPQYIQDAVVWRRSISQFARDFTFEGLEILDFNEDNDRATVTFTAHLSHQGKDASFTEKSQFEKVGGQWLYLRREK